MFLQALEGQRRVHGDEHTYTLRVVFNLARLYEAQERYNEAASLYIETLTGFRKALGPDNTDALSALRGLVESLVSHGAYEEAEPLARELVSRLRRVGPVPSACKLADALYFLGQTLIETGHAEEAESLLEEARAARGEDSPDD